MRKIIFLTLLSCFLCTPFAYAQSIILQAEPKQSVNQTVLTESKLILRERLRYFSINNARIAPLPHGFVIDLPAMRAEKRTQLIDLLLCTCRLEIRALKEASHNKDVGEITLNDLEAVTFSNEIIGNARVGYIETLSSTSMYLDIAPKYQDAFTAFTKANIGNIITLTIDNNILTVATLHGVMYDSMLISGLDSFADAENVAFALNSGVLPLKFSMSTIK